MPESTTQPLAATAEEMERQLVRLLGEILYVEPATIDPAADFSVLGLDSILAVEFGALLEQDMGITVPAAKVYEHRTPRLFARYLSSRASD
jgi:acyl carrier protein